MLRDYQVDLKNRIYEAWQDPRNRNVMATMATGGGKSVVIGSVLQDFNAPSVVIAHRSELISQLSLTLNRESVPHGIIAPKDMIRQIIALEIETHGRSFYSARAPARVASAHTLAVRDPKDRWHQQVTLAVVDEGHHVLRDSIWEKSLDQFPNARGLFKTAHAVRADGAGLGRHADGLVDALVVGPCGRDLIDRGFLTDYTVKCPPSDIDISDVPVGPSGEFVHDKLREKIHKSRTIVGDIVRHYVHHAGGKLGLTFAVDIEEATKIRAAFESANVPAEIITAKTPIPLRAAIMRRFRARQLLQLVSVDVLSEGTDVPAVEVVSLGRHTMSWQLMCQQIGRVLRVSVDGLAAFWDTYTDAERLAAIAQSKKPKALILDHVDNVRRHYMLRGMFDSPQAYTLDRRERRSRKTAPDAIPLRTCLNEECLQPYEAFLNVCPYCGTPKPAPGRRGTPEQVDGDLGDLDIEALKLLTGEISRVDGAARIPQNVTPTAAAAIKKNHAARQMNQGVLREVIALWAGWQKGKGLHDSEIRRLFWFRFDIDVMSAQTLGATEAVELIGRISRDMEVNGVLFNRMGI